MTISPFKVIIAGLTIALVFFGLGWWSYPAYVDREWRLGAQAAKTIASKCGVPDWALYYDIDGRRARSGWGPGNPDDAGIYMQANYGHCPRPEYIGPIRCAEAEASKRGYKFVREFQSGGCDENHPE